MAAIIASVSYCLAKRPPWGGYRPELKKWLKNWIECWRKLNGKRLLRVRLWVMCIGRFGASVDSWLGCAFGRIGVVHFVSEIVDSWLCCACGWSRPLCFRDKLRELLKTLTVRATFELTEEIPPWVALRTGLWEKNIFSPGGLCTSLCMCLPVGLGKS